ncbi:flagellar basal body protein [Herbaspirillum rubrisubalbicans]|uniref:flagellar basal body rod protein FlgB n=1 Tax=Herbaspirillum rubrisubalbicans TaxID=80842 RepID=UPI000DC60EFC|nr:flagellar basal body protein [Herbaspirillum rubrisubalbicans]RAN48433.1 flagellar basal body protein [Herbaspirillum rubrisubalbicans]
MTDAVETITTHALGLALDAASLRQQAIAANIANVGASGYVPLRVNFESQLEDARRTLASEGALDAHALDGVVPRLEARADANGVVSPVRLDVEMADMAQNAIQYQALLRGLSKNFSILSLAIDDGRKGG